MCKIKNMLQPFVVLSVFLLFVTLAEADATTDLRKKRVCIRKFVAYIDLEFVQIIKPICLQLNHQPLIVEDHKLSSLCAARKLKVFNDTLAHILIPRVVGTDGHATVQKYIKNTMQSLKWHVETDPFKAATPNLGTLAFENIIVTLNPNAERFLVLACHYDSKYFPNQTFLGASDSAVPCAMLIDLAVYMAPYLNQIRDNDELSLQLLFLDGEEAFLEWSSTDSIYGARHLAERWEQEDVLKKIVRQISLFSNSLC